jgi:endoglucanase
MTTIGLLSWLQVPSGAADVDGRDVATAPTLHLGPAVNIEGWFRWNKDTSTWDDYMTVADVQELVDLGFESVRLALFPQYFMEDDGSVDLGRWEFVDAAVDRLTAAGLSVVVDLHSEVQVMRPFLKDSRYRAHYATFVGQVAALVSPRDPAVVGLSLFNEPHDTGSHWNRWQRRLYDAARAGAPATTLVLTGDDWGSAKGLIKHTTYIEDPNLVWDVHIYDPFAFTHQGASWVGGVEQWLRKVPYPSTPKNVRSAVTKSLKAAPDALDDQVRDELSWYGHQRWNAKRVARVMKKLARWSTAHQDARVWIGEFGVINSAPRPSAYRWWSDMRTAADAAGISWSTWFWWDWAQKYGGASGYDAGLARALLG